ncbi:MAG: GNAT family N-acetyltransferase [Bacteroidota bacterium]
MLTGKTVRLRPFHRSDLPSMVRWNNDPEVEYFVDCDLPKDLHACEIWFADNIPSRDYRLFALEDENGRLIGDLELDHISWRTGEAELRIRIGEKDYWNKGYGTDAVSTLLEMAFGAMDLRRIYLRVYRFNRRAIKCYEKCGLRKQGVLQRKNSRGSEWKDIVLMAIERDCWLSRREIASSRAESTN